MKRLELFKELFDATITDKRAWENMPYVGYSEQEDKVVYSLTLNELPILTGTISDRVFEQNITENDILFYGNKGRTVSVDINRGLSANMLNSLTLPFTLYSLEGTPLENCQIVKFTGSHFDSNSKRVYDYETVNVSKETPMEAGVPYFAIPSTRVSSPMHFDNVVLEVLSNKDCKDLDLGDLICRGFIFPYIVPSDYQAYILITNSQFAELEGTTESDRTVYGMRTVIINK